MNPLNIFNIRAEIRRMVDLILEQDAGDFVADEVGGLDGVGGCVEEVGLEGARCDGELQVPTCFHVRVADGTSPQFDGVRGHGIFRRGLLVFAVERLV